MGPGSPASRSSPVEQAAACSLLGTYYSLNGGARKKKQFHLFDLKYNKECRHLRYIIYCYDAYFNYPYLL